MTRPVEKYTRLKSSIKSDTSCLLLVSSGSLLYNLNISDIKRNSHPKVLILIVVCQWLPGLCLTTQSCSCCKIHLDTWAIKKYYPQNRDFKEEQEYGPGTKTGTTAKNYVYIEVNCFPEYVVVTNVIAAWIMFRGEATFL